MAVGVVAKKKIRRIRIRGMFAKKVVEGPAKEKIRAGYTRRPKKKVRRKKDE